MINNNVIPISATIINTLFIIRPSWSLNTNGKRSDKGNMIHKIWITIRSDFQMTANLNIIFSLNCINWRVWRQDHIFTSWCDTKIWSIWGFPFSGDSSGFDVFKGDFSSSTIAATSTSTLWWVRCARNNLLSWQYS